MGESDGADPLDGLPLDPRLITSQDDFARMLRVLLHKSGLSMRRLAQMLDRHAEPNTPKLATVEGWLNGKHLPTPSLTAGFVAMINILGVEERSEVALWLETLERIRSQPGPRAGSETPPYRGLASYEPEHAHYFCGRAALVEELFGKFGRDLRSQRPVMVIGPSGSGKSSLLRAGLIPSLCGPDSNRSLCMGYLIFTPTSDPVSDLAREIAKAVGRSESDLLDRVREDVDALTQFLEPSPAGDGRPLLVVVDQFEQLFTTCPEPEVQRLFVDALHAAASGGAVVALGMRSDFYTKALELPQLREVLQGSHLLVGPMSEDELRLAITGPAAAATPKLNLQPGLVEVVMRDLAPVRPRGGTGAAHDPGALPLLSHALLATWEHARGHTLTIDHYRRAGGINGAVARTAEEAFLGLSSLHAKDIARRVFIRLVQSNDDTADTRRRVPVKQLLDLGEGDARDVVQAVLDRFIVARLLTVDNDEVVIVHEAVLSAWPRLVGWLDVDQGWRSTHRRLQVVAHDWHDYERPNDSLYRGSALQSALEWVDARGYRTELNQVERDFLAASARAEAEHALQQRRQRQRRQRTVAALVVLALFATGGMGYAIQSQLSRQRERATEATAHQQALSRLIAAKADRLRQRDPGLAMQLALTGYRTSDTPEARSSLLNSTAVPTATRLHADSGNARSLVITPQGDRLAAGTDDGTVQMWTLHDHPTLAATLVTGVQTSLGSIAISPDGNTLAAGGKNNLIYIWDLRNGGAPQTLKGAAGSVVAVAISGDNRTLAASSAKNVLLWRLADISSGTPSPTTLAAATGTVNTLAFMPDNHTLAAGSSDSSVYVWDTRPATPALLSVLAEPTSKIFSLAVSPDGHTLAAGTGAEHNVYLWNVTNPRQPTPLGHPLTGPDSWINAVAFNPDGRTLAAASSDSYVWIFDLHTGQPVQQLPHPVPVTAARYNGGRQLATIARDGTVRLWAVPGPVITGAADTIFTATFDARGQTLAIAAGSADNQITVWDTTDRHQPITGRPPLIPGPQANPLAGAGAMTLDGRKIAAGSTAGDVELWELSTTGEPKGVHTVFHAADDQIEALTFTNDGNLLAVSSDDGTVRLVNVSDTAHPRTDAKIEIPGAGLVYQAAFQPHGALLAIADVDGNVYLWNVSDPHHPAPMATLSGFTAAAYSVAFSPNGQLLAAGSADDTVRLWDVSKPSNPKAIGAALAGPVGYIYSVAFRADGSTLAAGSTDGTIWLWDLSNRKHPTHLATLTAGTKAINTVSFDPASDTLAAGGVDRAVRLWNTDPEAAARWICSMAGTPMTQQEWQQYVAEGAYQPPCP